MAIRMPMYRESENRSWDTTRVSRMRYFSSCPAEWVTGHQIVTGDEARTWLNQLMDMPTPRIAPKLSINRVKKHSKGTASSSGSSTTKGSSASGVKCEPVHLPDPSVEWVSVRKLTTGDTFAWQKDGSLVGIQVNHYSTGSSQEAKAKAKRSSRP